MSRPPIEPNRTSTSQLQSRIMTRPIALIGHFHSCPVHGGGPVIDPGQVMVRFNGIPIAVEGGIAAVLDRRPFPSPWSRGPILSGSMAMG